MYVYISPIYVQPGGWGIFRNLIRLTLPPALILIFVYTQRIKVFPCLSATDQCIHVMFSCVFLHRRLIPLFFTQEVAFVHRVFFATGQHFGDDSLIFYLGGISLFLYRRLSRKVRISAAEETSTAAFHYPCRCGPWMHLLSRSSFVKLVRILGHMSMSRMV